MAHRSMWKGAVQFGLVSIPVRVYTATENLDVSFHLLHKDDNVRVKQQRFCPVEEQVIEWTDVVRGYEYAPDQYVVVTDEDLDRAAGDLARTCEIKQFVANNAVDPIRFEKSYYIEPDKNGEKSFALLWFAMKSKDLNAIATIVMRNKERLCVILPIEGGGFVLSTLFYEDEIKSTEGLDINVFESLNKINEQELDLACQIIDSMTREISPGEYTDGYRKILLEMIEAKAAGNSVTPPSKPHSGIGDLMDQLKASISAQKEISIKSHEGVRTGAR